MIVQKLQGVVNNKVLFYFEILFVLLLLGLNLGSATNGHWANRFAILHDIAVFVVAAVSHNEGLGVPYKDYWDYRPPGFFFLIDLWTKIFGMKILSFKVLETLFRLLVGVQICFLIRAVFPPFKALLVILLTLFVFFSPLFGAGWYPETYGISFSLTGLLCLFYVKKLNWRFFSAALFFSLSTQMKDIYGGAVLAIIPPLVYFLAQRDYHSFSRACIFAFLGYVLPITFLAFYLLRLGSFNAYLEVLQAKSVGKVPIYEDVFLFVGHYYHTFKAGKNILTLFWCRVPYVVLFWFISVCVSFLLRSPLPKLTKISTTDFVVTVPLLKFQITTEFVNAITMAFYAFGSLLIISFAYNLSSAHYIFSLVIPTYFIWCLAVWSFACMFRFKNRSLVENAVFVVVLIFFLFPANPLTTEYTRYGLSVPQIVERIRTNLSMADVEMPVENYINSKTTKDECVLSVYGWGSAETYLHSKRRPCTRFIIPNLVFFEWQQKEYKESIINNPPAVIYYTYAGADMDPVSFERVIINLKRILNDCYRQDFTYTKKGGVFVGIYLPLYYGKDLNGCIKQNADTLN